MCVSASNSQRRKTNADPRGYQVLVVPPRLSLAPSWLYKSPSHTVNWTVSVLVPPNIMCTMATPHVLRRGFACGVLCCDVDAACAWLTSRVCCPAIARTPQFSRARGSIKATEGRQECAGAWLRGTLTVVSVWASLCVEVAVIPPALVSHPRS